MTDSKQKKRCLPSGLFRLLIALAAGIAVGCLLLLLPQETRGKLAADYLAPIVSAFIGLLAAVAAPLVFLSVIDGIVGIGDAQTFGRIGKRVFLRFLLACSLTSLVIMALCLALYRPPFAGGAATDFSALLGTVLGVVPRNFIAPFAENNLVQIIFLAILIGVAMLFLDKKSCTVSNFVSELNAVVQKIMHGISLLIPAFVFLSVVRLVIGGELNAIANSYRIVLTFAVGNAILIVLHLLAVCLRLRVSPLRFLRKCLPVLLIGLTTASSNAAFDTNLRTCREELGIDGKIVSFGVPLGQVVYMPSCAMGILIYAIAFAAQYRVEISLSWLFLAFITAVIVSVAVPPIPAGVLSCITVLFTLLGIDPAALAVIVVLEGILDFLGTPTNLFCLQAELVLSADSLSMLDRDTLGRPISTRNDES